MTVRNEMIGCRQQWLWLIFKVLSQHNARGSMVNHGTPQSQSQFLGWCSNPWPPKYKKYKAGQLTA